MSGEVKQNTSVATGVIATAPSATQSASDPAINTNPEDTGAEWHNTTTGEIFICRDNTAGLNVWVGQKGGVVHGARGIFMGGKDAESPSVPVNTIDFVNITSTGDASDFGDLLLAIEHNTGTSNGKLDRAVDGGGMVASSTASLKTLEYVTISSAGNAKDFADLTVTTRQFAACSNASHDRGVFGGGYTGSPATGAPSNSTTNILGYITISSTSNATDFGDCSTSGVQDEAATSSGTNERGLFMGGNRIYLSNVIDYITISTPGNATDFGNLSTNVSYPAACSNQTNERAIRAGGYDGSQTNVIEYVTMTTTGNTTDFGDLDTAVYGAEGTDNGVLERGLCSCGGYPGGVNHNVIEYITISTPGDGQDFGDLTVARANFGAASDAG